MINKLFVGDLITNTVDPLVVQSVIFNDKFYTITKTLLRPVGVGDELANEPQLLIDLINKEGWGVIRWYNPVNWYVRICILLGLQVNI